MGRGGGGIRDLGRRVGDVPGQPGSYGRGKTGDEREMVKVGGFWGAGRAPGTQTEENQTLALTELRRTRGVSSVSGMEEEEEGGGGDMDGEKWRKRQTGSSQDV